MRRPPASLTLHVPLARLRERAGVRAFAALSFLLSTGAFAQAVDPAPDDPSLLWTLVRVLVVLSLVVGLVYLTLNVGLRRLLGVPLGGQLGKLVTVLDRTQLDAKHYLLVIKAGNEFLLVSSGEGGVNLITKLDPTEVEKIQAEKPVGGMPMSPFLMKLLSRKGGPPPPTA